MNRASLFAFGLALGLLSFLGFTTNGVPIWMPLVDFAGALSAVVFAWTEHRTRGLRASPIPLAALFIAIGLTSVWILGLATAVVGWASWGNFGFALAFLMLSVVLSTRAAHPHLSAHMFPFGAAMPYHWATLGSFPYEPYSPAIGHNIPNSDFNHKSHFVGVGPRQYRRSDWRIEEEVNDRLTTHWEIDPTEVVVQCRDGVITLTGTVPSKRSRRLAEEIAELVPGVRDVVNHLSERAMPLPQLGGAAPQSSPIRAA